MEIHATRSMSGTMEVSIRMKRENPPQKDINQLNLGRRGGEGEYATSPSTLHCLFVGVCNISQRKQFPWQGDVTNSSKKALKSRG